MTMELDNLASALVTPERPWPGLAAFDESARAYFFGREADGDELLRLVKRETLTVLFGQSGLGKTSLLQAGLFPKLRRDHCLPILVRLVHAEDGPPLAEQIKSAIAEEITGAQVDAPKPQPGQTLWEYFHRAGADFWSRRQHLLTPVIVIDQFEELFTIGRASDKARQHGQALVSALADLIENRPPESLKASLENGTAEPTDYNFDPAAFRVVITLRADFLSELESLCAAIPSIQINRMALLPLNGGQAREAVIRPGGDLVEDDVALRIVQFVAGASLEAPTEDQLRAMRVEPALLSIICRELNERRLARKIDTITADLVAGDRAEILNHFYERSLSGISTNVRRWVEDTLLTVSGYRNSQDLDDAVANVGRENIDTLVARRLLRIDDRFGTQRVELTHDVLAAPVRASRDDRYQLEQLARATAREKQMRLELRAARRRMAMVSVLVLFLLGFGLISYWQRHKATAAEIKADEATRAAQKALRVAQDRLVTSLSYEGNYLVLTNRIADARQVLYQGMNMLPETSVSPLWISAPLLDIEARFDGPVSIPAAFHGHTNRVSSVAVSPDGKLVLSGSSDTTLKLWSAATGKLIRTFTGHTGTVTSVAFSPDGRQALSGSTDKKLLLWDVATGKPIRAFEGHTERTRGVFSPDGRMVLSGSDDTTLRLWDVATGKPIESFIGKGHTKPVEAVAISRDGRRALSGSDDKTVKLWDMATGTVIHTFEQLPDGHTETVRGVAFSPDGKVALSAGEDFCVKLWDLESFTLVRNFKGNFDGADLHKEHIMAHTDQVWDVAFAPDGKTALSASDDKTLKLWDVDKGTELRTFAGHTDWVSKVAFSPDGRTAYSASVDRTLKAWDVTTSEEIPKFSGSTDQVRHLAVSPDGFTALTVGNDKTVRLLDLATLREIQSFKGHEAPVLSVAYLPDSRKAISCGEDKTMRMWDLESGSEIGPTFRGHTGMVWSVAVSSDGRRALTGSADKTMKLWDLETHKEIRTFDVAHTDEIFCVALSPDGRTALSASKDKSLKMWDVESGKLLRDLKGHNGWVISVAYSPDGRMALSGGADKTMKLWDTATGEEIRSFAGHTNSVLSVAFSPDARTVMSGSWDKTLKIWDLANGKEIQTFVGHTDWIRSVAFATGGQVALSASNDNSVRLWDFSRPARHAQFEADIPGARVALAKNPDDPGALALMGQWYAYRGNDALAVELLEHARQTGGKISPLMLGRCCWKLGRFTDALTQFKQALQQKESSEAYLRICMSALERGQAGNAQRH